MRDKLKLFIAVATTAVATFSTSAAIAREALPQAKRVLIVVFDQMRPEYAQRFDMKNVLALQAQGVHFPNGYLGHMPSETVISHNVMVSGVFPKRMGWADEAYRDTANLLGKGVNAMWETGSLTPAQFGTLVRKAAYPKLADYLHVARPGGKFIVVGQKNYAVDSVAAPSADIAVKMSDRQKDVSKETGCANLGGQWRFPAGSNVPGYLTEPKCGRFYINSDKTNDYTTKSQSPARMYPLDGNRFVPGTDPEHLGGDAWVADAAMAMMENENWSGMLVTMGGIDKAGHMWGAHMDKEAPAGNADEQTHVPFAARFADEQLGRMLKKLRDLGQLDDTLVVLTADHGATYAENFHGIDAVGQGDYNWYYGATVNSENYNKPAPVLKPLLDTDNIQFIFASTCVATWLKDPAPEKKRAMAQLMRSMPGVVATYVRNGDRFELDATGKDVAASMRPDELAWWKKNAQALLDTMAADNGPDAMALLADGYSYSVRGDHGSPKENDQRVPMVIWSPRIKAEKPAYAFRSVDILPTVLGALGIRQDFAGDGKAWPLKFTKSK